MASWAVFGVPAAIGPVTVMSAAAASKGGDKKAGLFDWLNGALDKSSMTEMDPILQKDSAAPPPRPSAPSKKAAPPKKQGGSGGGFFFGLGKK